MLEGANLRFAGEQRSSIVRELLKLNRSGRRKRPLTIGHIERPSRLMMDEFGQIYIASSCNPKHAMHLWLHRPIFPCSQSRGGNAGTSSDLFDRIGGMREQTSNET